MSDVNKEGFEGDFEGKHVSFNRVWRGHRFTDDEIVKLMAGQEIEVHDLTSAKTGNSYSVKGKLARQSFMNDDGKKVEFFGFEQTGFVYSDSIPPVFCQHRFTDEEKALLLAGETLSLSGLISKKGNTFDAAISYGTKPGEDRKSLILSFD